MRQMTTLERYLSSIGDDSLTLTESQADARLRSKLSVFWRLAMNLADLSRCKRLRVGCVIIRPDLSEVLAIGYNGPARGLDNGGCRKVEGSCGCQHAEANALVKLRSSESDLVLLTTVTPCEHCAGLILNSGRVASVIAGMSYRDAVRPLEVLVAGGVGLWKVSDLLGDTAWV